MSLIPVIHRTGAGSWILLGRQSTTGGCAACGVPTFECVVRGNGERMSRVSHEVVDLILEFASGRGAAERCAVLASPLRRAPERALHSRRETVPERRLRNRRYALSGGSSQVAPSAVLGAPTNVHLTSRTASDRDVSWGGGRSGATVRASLMSARCGSSRARRRRNQGKPPPLVPATDLR